jgi:hypothetical protein
VTAALGNGARGRGEGARGGRAAGAISLPHSIAVNDTEGLVFVAGGAGALPCAACSRSRLEPPLVRSGGCRVDAFSTRPGDAPAVPICWECVREKARGGRASSLEWRAALARFLNALNGSDPATFRCGLRGLY